MEDPVGESRHVQLDTALLTATLGTHRWKVGAPSAATACGTPFMLHNTLAYINPARSYHDSRRMRSLRMKVTGTADNSHRSQMAYLRTCVSDGFKMPLATAPVATSAHLVEGTRSIQHQVRGTGSERRKAIR